MPASAFRASQSASSADRVLFFENNNYTIHWACRQTGQPNKWLQDGDASMADTAARIVVPGEGFLVQPRATPVTRVFTGELRGTKLVVTASAAKLLGTGNLLAVSPQNLGMTTGWAAAATPEAADRIRLWLGDATPGSTGYTSYYLHSAGHWVDQSDTNLAPQEQANLFAPFRAAFIVTTAARTLTLNP
jgi:hypothetical protein